MFRIYLKNRIRTYKNEGGSYDENLDLDLDFDESHMGQLDAIVGANGVGKSFLCQNVVYLAFLYKEAIHRNKVNSGDVQKIIAKLFNSGIGDILQEAQLNKIKLKENQHLVSLFTSYNPKKIAEKQSDPLGKRYFFIISARTKKILDNWNIFYYSNSQFPSNERFFSWQCSSFQSSDIDLVFWKIHFQDKDNLKISYWVNYSSLELRKEEKVNVENFEKALGDWDRFFDRISYRNRNIFNFISKKITKEDVLKAEILKDVFKLGSTDEKLPDAEEKKLSSMKVIDYIALIALKEVFGRFDFELLVAPNKKEPNIYISYKLLNSGKKYEFVLSILEKVCKEKGILFIDEPENSLHLQIQDELANETIKNCKLNLITHSPAFISSLIRKSKDSAVIHILREKKDVIYINSLEGANINSFSLDSVSAEFLGYAPFVDFFASLNKNIDESNMMSINDFYENVGKKRK